MLTIKTSKANLVLKHLLNDVTVVNETLTTPAYARDGFQPTAKRIPDLGVTGSGARMISKYTFLSALNPAMHRIGSTKGEGVAGVVDDVANIDPRLIGLFCCRCLNVSYTDSYASNKQVGHGWGFAYYTTGAGAAIQKWDGNSDLKVAADWYTRQGEFDALTTAVNPWVPILLDINDEMGEVSTDYPNTSMRAYAAIDRLVLEPKAYPDFPKPDNDELSRSAGSRPITTGGWIRTSNKYDGSVTEWHHLGGKSKGLTRLKGKDKLGRPCVGPVVLQAKNVTHTATEANTKAIATSSAWRAAYPLAANTFAFLAYTAWVRMVDPDMWGAETEDNINKKICTAINMSCDHGYSACHYDFSKVVIPENAKPEAIYTTGVTMDVYMAIDLAFFASDTYHSGASALSTNMAPSYAHGYALCGGPIDQDRIERESSCLLGPRMPVHKGIGGVAPAILCNENGMPVYGVEALDVLRTSGISAPGAIGHVIGTGDQGNEFVITMNEERNVYDWYDHGPIDGNLNCVAICRPRRF